MGRYRKIATNKNILSLHMNLPSRHQIGDPVILNFHQSGKLTNCFIENIHFTAGKVYYDVKIFPFKGDPNNHPDPRYSEEDLANTLQMIDSYFVDAVMEHTGERKSD